MAKNKSAKPALPTGIDEDEIKSLVEGAGDEFELLDRLQNRGMREDSITIFTNEVLADEHLAVEQEIARLTGAAESIAILEKAAGDLGLEKIEAYLKKQAKAARDAAAKEDPRVAELQKKKEGLLEQLRESAYEFKLRAVPTIIVKGQRRKVKKLFGIVGKQIPETVEDLFVETINAHVLSQVVREFTDKESGKSSRLSPAAAQRLGDLLPEPEFERLMQKMAEVQFKNSITESVTASADFSRGI